MIKIRITSFLMAILLFVLSLASCSSELAQISTENTAQTGKSTDIGKKQDNSKLLVNAPATMPNYALREGAATDEMRAMAIQAMRDQLSVQWTPVQNFEYQKEGVASDLEYVFKRGTVYGGMPYTNAASGLFQWLQYYDFKTGVLSGCDFDYLNYVLGNTCGTSVFWAWFSVCTSVSATTSGTINILHGCLPVGNYTYDSSIESFVAYSTEQICKDNGQDVIFQSYAAMLPADAVVAIHSRENHVMMAIEKPHVEYTADGKIDGKKSTLTVQEKGPWQSRRAEGDQLVSYIGRVKATYTFQELFDTCYLPVTTKEFLGQQPYVKGSVTYESEGAAPGTLESLYSGKLVSSHYIAVLDVLVTDETGAEIHSKKILFNGTMIQDGIADAYPLSKLDLNWHLKDKLTAGKPYHARITVLTATGESFTPCDFDFTA